MTVETNKTTRLAVYRAIRAWVRDERPKVLFEVGVTAVYAADKDVVDSDALTVALAEAAAKFLIALHLDVDGPLPTPAEYRAAREDAEAWLDRQMLADLDFAADWPDAAPGATGGDGTAS